MPKYLPICTVSIGCDPELFVSDPSGKVIGSERVIPEKGLYWGGIVRDGVQIELHPGPSTCRATVSNSLTNIFAALKEQLDVSGMKADFASVIEISEEELSQLSQKAQVLGCQPSFNAYGRVPVSVDGRTNRQRSAAGHIHLGCEQIRNDVQPNGKIDPRKLAILQDVVLGNSCVLLDRDPLAAKRREIYGRAGEYRLPYYGMEYRTLSNFWLKGYPLFSLVTALARQTTQLAFGEHLPVSNNSPYITDGVERIVSTADIEMVERAINTNDFDLAWRTWDTVVKPLFSDIASGEGLSDNLIQYFEHLVDVGIDRFFKKDPLMHWVSKGDGHGKGWESFCYNVLSFDLNYKRTNGSLMPDDQLEALLDKHFNPPPSILDIWGMPMTEAVGPPAVAAGVVWKTEERN